jgi:hypothetical protein
MHDARPKSDIGRQLIHFPKISNQARQMIAVLPLQVLAEEEVSESRR